MRIFIAIFCVSLSFSCFSQENDTIYSGISVPNVITPDCDYYPCPGLKPHIIYPVTEIKNFEFRVFNRWGEMIFESNDLAEEWRPWTEEEDLPEGVYIWEVKYRHITDADGDGITEHSEEVNRGHVTYLK